MFSARFAVVSQVLDIVFVSRPVNRISGPCNHTTASLVGRVEDIKNLGPEGFRNNYHILHEDKIVPCSRSPLLATDQYLLRMGGVAYLGIHIGPDHGGQGSLSLPKHETEACQGL